MCSEGTWRRESRLKPGAKHGKRIHVSFHLPFSAWEGTVVPTAWLWVPQGAVSLQD